MIKSLSRREVLKSLMAAGTVSALQASRAPVHASFGDSPLEVFGRPVDLTISAISRYTLRIKFAAITGESEIVPASNDSLVQSDWQGPRKQFKRIAELRDFQLGDFSIKFGSEPLSFSIETNGRIVQRLRIDKKTGALSFELGKSPVLGLGEGGPQFDRRGNADQMRSGQGGYRLRTHGGRVPVQWLIGTSGWAIYIHQPTGTFDLTAQEGLFVPKPNTQLPLDVFLVATTDPVAVMGEYARLTGFPEMPPLWSLGYLQSHRTLRGPEEVKWVARTFREKKLPCDALIYLGTDFTPSGWNTHNGEFTWHPTNFPDPKSLVNDLHRLNFKVVLHTVLEGRRLTGKVSEPCTAVPLPSGRTTDNRWPDDRQVSCYWPVHKQLYDVGIDGWWPDQGDGLDGPSRLARNRMYFEGSQQLRPNERPFALHRNGQAGMQRFAAFLWSGDVYSTWETLKNHVPIAVNTGLSGIPYWGTDIGGFVPTKEYTGELHVRWFQFGAFCPLFRAHGRTWHLRLPWGWNTGELGISEVSNYTGGAADPDESELHNSQVEPICRQYLELRYQLMPYLYSVVREGCKTGLPIIRALWLHHSDDPETAGRGDEFLWGRDILVAPVIEKGATTRELYLPLGAWFDFWTGEKVAGGRQIKRGVDLATVPLYVRAGAVIPFGPVKQYTEERVDGPTVLRVYPGADGAFTLYEDDGKTFNFRRGEWTGIRLAWNDKAHRLSLELARGSRLTQSNRRVFDVQLATERATQRIEFSGRPINIRL
ncbi:MAG TPA: TIM-barrel domain-containing protein [Pyrinomonadaceae bacterium]|nr:TIM-barrel domain-containing protein [Pyrinomonadaceae bacterium]